MLNLNMKKNIIFPIVLVAAISANAASFTNATSGNLYWSDESTWLDSSHTSPAGQIPTASDTFLVWYQNNTMDNPLEIFVDVDATIKGITFNYTSSATALNLYDNADNATSFKIDAASANTEAALINLGSGDASTTSTPYFAFEGVIGSKLHLTNSLDSSNYVTMRFDNKGKVDGKYIRFGQNVSVTSDRNIKFIGGTGEALTNGYNYQFAGDFVAKDGDVYKDVFFDGAVGGLIATVESTGSITANKFSFLSSATVIVNGAVNVKQAADWSMSSGNFTINGNFNIGDNNFAFGGGNLTVGGNNAITASSITIQGSATGSRFTVAEGANFTSTLLKGNTKQSVIVNGIYNTAISGSIVNVSVGKNGAFNMTNQGSWTIFGGDWVVDGKVSTVGFTGDSKIASGKMIVNKGAEFIHNYGNLNLDGYQNVWSEIGKKAILVINGSDVFHKTAGGSQKDFSLNISRGDVRIEMNASNYFNRIGFSTITDSAQTGNLTLFLADNILLELNSLSGLSSTNFSSLILENFGLGKFKVYGDTSGIDCSKISSSDAYDGEAMWEDFRFEDGWLVATLVPEPATVASLLGLLVLAFAVARRRRNQSR